MGYCLFCSLLVLSTTGIPPLAASADQGGRLVGVHELPAFVRDRVELPPGTFDRDEPPADPRPNHRVGEDAGAG